MDTIPPTTAHRLIVPAIILAGFVVYANSFSNAFVWDDASSILLHQHVQDPSKIVQLFREDQHAFGRGLGAFYRPLVSVSFMADYLLTTAIAPVGEDATPTTLQQSLSPFLFHMTNTVWHVLAAVLLYGVLVRFRAPIVVCAGVALLWVVHPLHTEAVTYISGRADSMAAAFMFAALLFATSRTLGPVAATLLSVLCFAGGLLSKESAMIYPALLFLGMLCLPRSGDTPRGAARWAPLAGAIVTLVIYGVLKLTVLAFPSDSTTPDTGFGQRVVEMLQALSLYIGLIFAPLGLHMERSLVGVSGILALPGAIALVAMIAGAVYAYRSDRKRLAFALGWFVVTWLPISGIFPLNAPMAEHWLYVPLAGFLWALGELVAPFLRARPAQAVAGFAFAVWMVALVGIAVDRNRDWRTNESIFRATLAENPDSLRVRYNLAVTYEDLTQNRIGAVREFSRFIEDYQGLKSVEPDRAVPYMQTAMEAGVSLGGLFFERGRIPEAAQQFGAVIEAASGEALDPEEAALVAQASIGMGQCFQAIGNSEAAQEQFERAVQLRPDLAGAVQQLQRGGVGRS